MPDDSFPKTRRLLKSSEFDTVFAAKQSAADGMLIVYSLANELEHPRLGLVVSRQVGNAVRRNRWKRLLREAFRLSQNELPAVDLVVLPRFRGEPTLAALSGSLVSLAKRLEKRAAKRQAQREEAQQQQIQQQQQGKRRPGML